VYTYRDATKPQPTTGDMHVDKLLRGSFSVIKQILSPPKNKRN